MENFRELNEKNEANKPLNQARKLEDKKGKNVQVINVEEEESKKTNKEQPVENVSTKSDAVLPDIGVMQVGGQFIHGDAGVDEEYSSEDSEIKDNIPTGEKSAQIKLQPKNKSQPEI